MLLKTSIEKEDKEELARKVSQSKALKNKWRVKRRDGRN
jgi:hypothetical protein